MSRLRARVAERLLQSQATNAILTTFNEVNMAPVMEMRKKFQEKFEKEHGVKIGFMSFFVKAAVHALKKYPVLNASVAGNSIIYRKRYNIGIAVALDWGLIVPVIKRADDLSIAGLAKAANDLADRARAKQLKPDEVAGGTFTVTNPGVFGGLFGTPIINQPQVAILGVGGVKKRPVVVETKDGDFIAIRSMCYFSLGFDHRLIDGAVADQFMARVKEIIEKGQFTM